MVRDTTAKVMLYISLFIGMIFFCFPIINNLINNNKYKNYISIIATYKEASSPHIEDETLMYYLKYYYNVDGIEYIYTTDYSVSALPKKGSTIEIKYNPNNPSSAYATSIFIFDIFQVVGVFFICLSLVMLFPSFVWLRDITIFFLGIYCIFICINYKLYTVSGKLFLIVGLLILINSVKEFIKYIKNYRLNPSQDIKNEIINAKKIKQEKIEAKKNMTGEEHKAKIKNILIGLALFIVPVPFMILINIFVGYPNDIVYYLCVCMSCLLTMTGFAIVGISLLNINSNKNSEYIHKTIRVGNKILSEDEINDLKNMSFIEKWKH